MLAGNKALNGCLGQRLTLNSEIRLVTRKYYGTINLGAQYLIRGVDIIK